MEYHHMMFTLTAGPTDLAAGMLNGADADAHLQNQISGGWEVAGAWCPAINAQGATMVYLLKRGAEKIYPSTVSEEAKTGVREKAVRERVPVNA